jgi:3-oxoacyl-[acyl-carrier protein] reductase
MSNIFSPTILNNKIAFVTGATRGIGAAIAKSLAQAGAFVVGSATTENGAKQITTMLGGKGRGVILDVTDNDSMTSSISDILSKEGTIHILVNNAGIAKDNLLIRMKDDDWDTVINANLNGIFKLCKLSLKTMMKQRHGRIINISSVVGLMGNAGQTNYAAAKAGVIGLSKSLAREVGSRNITVNVVAPGFIKTDMTKNLTFNQTEKMLAQVPLGRLGETDEIAASVVFLASDSAAYISGETININGGMLMN